jgi:Na+-translocating ferredoxin:NAD+ oxidoreductase RnfG subunit/Pyruvate/2-oxoacid:ferredoxin oxidoreductase delta subunit
MKNYQLITIIFLVLFILGSGFNLLREFYLQKQGLLKEQKAVTVIFPESQGFIKETGKTPHYKIYRTSSQTAHDIIGIAFVTTDLSPEIRGYAGPIKMLVGMNTSGAILKTHVISHSETPSYVLELDEFIKQFSGRGIRDSFRLGKDIDGITRATITSEAISRSVEKGLKITGREVLGLSSDTISEEKTNIPVDQILIPLALFGVAVTGVLSHSTTLRWIALTGGFFYFGIIKSTMISVVQIANICLLKLPVPAQSPLWYMLVGLGILTTLVWGMIYCGSLCPFASVQEMIYNLSHKSRKGMRGKPQIPGDLIHKANHIKYVVLFTAIIVSVILGNAGAASMEPFLTLFARKGTTLAWGLVLLMLVAAAFYFRFWCRYLCPAGACLGLMAHASLFKIKLGEGCTHCAICDKVCPTDAIHMNEQKLPVIDYPECILCGQCVRKCPKQSLSLRGFAHHENGK